VNFGRDAHFEHGVRYDRAAEFHDVVIGLWDSWEDDAFLRDKKSGVWFDYDKMHILRHKGKHFTVRGPLNVARSPQGRPVVAQAGSSDIGMELAARTADMVFTAQTTIKEGQDFCNDMRSRVTKYGRGPEDIRIFPGIMPIVGRTKRRRARNTKSCARWSTTASASRAWRGSPAASTSSPGSRRTFARAEAQQRRAGAPGA
jgi:Coenzyme F420-dependent N5,N10-methylene tetrahydromethanopterin reductase and related flavin-dependent oxidoreductases